MEHGAKRCLGSRKETRHALCSMLLHSGIRFPKSRIRNQLSWYIIVRNPKTVTRIPNRIPRSSQSRNLQRVTLTPIPVPRNPLPVTHNTQPATRNPHPRYTSNCALILNTFVAGRLRISVTPESSAIFFRLASISSMDGAIKVNQTLY